MQTLKQKKRLQDMPSATVNSSVVKLFILYYFTLLLVLCQAQNLRSTKSGILEKGPSSSSATSRDLFKIKGNIKFDLDEKDVYSSLSKYNDDNHLHPSFELIDSEFLKEHNAESNTFKHKKTGAEIFFINWSAASNSNSTDSSSSIVEIDDESTFGIFFRTPPDDSTGVPHILEHSVLTGSRKYTTKSPFVDLLKGSMNTFLNALTWPDRTGYVVASRNVKDFYNLMNVYLDAVFFPRVVKDPFLLAQEGWHLEPNDFETLDNLTDVRDVELVRIN